MVSTEMISELLRGLHYPASRYDVGRHAIEHGATNTIIHVLDQLPERDFLSQDELWEEINRILALR